MTGGVDQPDPRPAAVTFITTEHFTLQGARAATIAESTGRATVFLGTVSGGLIALGLLGQASHLGGAFYASGLIVLPTLAFLGLFTSAAQKFLTIAGTVAVITSVITGATVGLLGAVVSSHSAAVAFSAGGATTVATLTLMIRYLAAQMARGLPTAGAGDATR